MKDKVFESARNIVEKMEKERLIARVAELLSENSEMKRRLGDYEKSDMKLNENLKFMFAAESCERHNEGIKKMSFSDFMAYNKEAGCRYCLHERTNRLINR